MARMTGREEPSAHQLRANIHKRVATLEEDLPLAKRRLGHAGAGSRKKGGNGRKAAAIAAGAGAGAAAAE